ncbi:MAG TPA: ester cyclase [Ignavibacteriaceae bacterium]|nr:ester cyclase [Ignavibacteriaceae bacterium]
MSVEKNKEAVREFTKVFKNEHNVDGIDHLFASNFKHNFKMPLKPGLEGYKEIGTIMNSAFPDVKVTEKDLFAADDTVVERSYAQATHKGEFMGIKPTNKKCDWSEIHIYRFDKSGKIIEHWVELSMLELINQLKT